MEEVAFELGSGQGELYQETSEQERSISGGENSTLQVIEAGKAGGVWGILHSPERWQQWLGEVGEKSRERRLDGGNFMQNVISHLCLSCQRQLYPPNTQPFPTRTPGRRLLLLSPRGRPIPFFPPPPRLISNVSPLCLLQPHHPRRFKQSVLSVLLAFCIYLYYSTDLF